MLTKVSGISEHEGLKISFEIDEETNDSRYHIEGSSSEYPYKELKVMIRRVKEER